MMKHGSAALTDAELLAILIRTGSRGATAVDLAKKLLSERRTLRDLARMSVVDLGQLGIAGCARLPSLPPLTLQEDARERRIRAADLSRT